MPTTAALMAEERVQIGLVFLIDGISIAWCTRADMIGLSMPNGHTLRLGLKLEGLVRRLAINPRTGMPDSDEIRIGIHDFEGDLAALFAVSDESQEPLDYTVYPFESLSARTNLHDKHIGTELIGASGARRRFPCIPDYTVGMLHWGGQDVDDLTMRPAPVSDNPIVWNGRRCALYEVYRDHITFPDPSTGPTSFRPFTEARRVWWGTLRDEGDNVGRDWTLNADGPSSWLRKDLGLTTQPVPVRINGTLQYEDDESYIGVALRVQRAFDQTATAYYGVRDFVTQFTATTTLELRQEIGAEVSAATAATGTDGVWDNQNEHTALMQDGEFLVAIPDTQDEELLAGPWIGYLTVVMHKRLWGHAGFDIAFQAALGSGIFAEEELYVFFSDYGAATPQLSGSPGDGYVVAVFTSIPVGIDPNANPGDADGSGTWRAWKPRFSGGVMSLRADLGEDGQIARLADGLLSTTIAHPGQLDRPPASDPNNNSVAYSLPEAGSADTNGYWLIFGKRRFENTEEEFDEYQIAEASWREGALTQRGLVQSGQIVIKKWLHPRLFGFDRPPLQSDWVANAEGDDETGIRAVPILYLGYSNASGAKDFLHVVLQRLMRTSGTSTGWWANPPTNTDPGYDGELPTIDAGDNEPTLAGIVKHDAEHADLGLSIPDDVMHSPIAFGLAVESLNDDVMRVKIGISPGTSSEDLISGMLRPAGLSFHLRDGKYGIQDQYATISDADVEVALTRTEREQRYRDRGPGDAKQNRRIYQPIDSFRISYDWAPYLNKFQRELEVQSSDRGRAYRPGGQPYDVTGHGFRADPASLEPKGWRERSAEIADWWERRHFIFRGYEVKPTTSRNVWPGTRVRLTEPSGVDPAGSYGVVTRRGLVTAIEQTYGAKGRFRCDILVQQDRIATPRIHCWTARGIGFDTDNDRLYVADNIWGVESTGTWSDASYFVEPAYVGLTALGGDARIKWLQWDGVTYAETGSADVVSVDTTPGSSYIEIDNITGSYFPERDSLVVGDDMDDQTALWMTTWYAPIGNAAGQYGAGPTDSPPWEP